MAARIPAELIGSYPPQTHGEFECKFFINKCRQCDTRYKPHEVLCGKCGTPRPRCHAKAQTNTDSCRAHMPRGVLSIYNLAASRFSEQAVEEVIETDDRSLDAELALAKMVLANILEDKDVFDTAKLKAIKEFLEVAMLRKKIESGEDLNIRFDDKTADAIRKRFKTLVQTFQSAIEEFVPDEATRQLIMDRVKAGSKIAGKYTPLLPARDGGAAGTRKDA